MPSRSWLLKLCDIVFVTKKRIRKKDSIGSQIQLFGGKNELVHKGISRRDNREELSIIIHMDQRGTHTSTQITDRHLIDT